jgi:GMP synthase (glutamine-hydrolysing)
MTVPKVLIVQHAPWERPGRVLNNLDDVDMPTQIVNVCRQEHPELPSEEELAGLVVMGGPMGARDYKKYPGLKAETKLVKHMVKANKPVLGICLGHQILATALGGKLSSGTTSEIGFAPIARVSKHDYFSMWSRSIEVLNWHNDVVSLPEGAQLLASSKHSENQAFCYGSALGLQFHLEVNSTVLEDWLAEPTMVADMKKTGIAKLRADFEQYDAQLKPLADQVFSSFAVRCVAMSRSM